jgi:mannosyl-oligosaccharide alpha-1,2-mannosidase
LCLVVVCQVTIRVLGGLLSAHVLSGEGADGMLLGRAAQLGEVLLRAFDSPSGIPYSDVNLHTGAVRHPHWGNWSSLAEATTLQLELRTLSARTGRPEFARAADRAMDAVAALPTPWVSTAGLPPSIYMNITSGQFETPGGTATITLGARGDSYYEYLLKQVRGPLLPHTHCTVTATSTSTATVTATATAAGIVTH